MSLPGESHGQTGLEGYSPWGCKELDTTEVTQHACMHLDIIHSLLFPGIYCLPGTLPPKDASALSSCHILEMFASLWDLLGGVYFPLYSLEFNSIIRSLEGCSPWSCKEPDTTEQLNSGSIFFGGSVVKNLPAKQ